MKIRAYRQTVEVQQLSGSTAADSRGKSQKAFETVETIQAAIMPMTGRELTLAREILPTVSHRVECYYTATMIPQARLKYGSRYFNVEAVTNVEERDRVQQALCTEKVV